MMSEKFNKIKWSNRESISLIINAKCKLNLTLVKEKILSGHEISFFPANIYLFKFNNKCTSKGVNYVQSKQ